MKKSDIKYKIRLVVFALLWVMVTAFIFRNSLQTADISNARSHGISDWLYSLPIFRNWMNEEAFHKLIRKIAHFTEFGVLGVCVGGFTINLGNLKNEKYISLPMLITLGTAVCDEFIQRFTGRTSSVKDIVIDFAGALCGIIFTWIISSIVRRRKNGKA